MMEVLQRTFLPMPTAVVQEIGEELIVLDMSSERYMSIDPVGAMIWNLLAQGNSLHGIIDAVANDYEVEPAVVTGDVLEFIDSLEGFGLIKCCTP